MDKKYSVIVEKGMDGYFIAEVPELPGCYSQGKTMKEVMSNVKEAIELYLESVQDLKKKPEKRFVAIREVAVSGTA